MEVIKDWPVATRALVVSAGVLSVAVHSTLMKADYVMYHPSFMLKMPPEIWRIVTAFLLTGGGLGILFDCYFLYTYSSQLERGSPRFNVTGSYFVFLVFNMAVILLLGGTYFEGPILLPPLILALTYTFCQDNPNANVSIFVLTFPAKYLPYAMLFISLCSGGPEACKVQASGLISAHLYDFLTRIWPTFGGGTNYIITPRFIQRWWWSLEQTGPQRRPYGTAFRPADDAPPPSGDSSGRSTATDGNMRGPGRRLG